MRCWQLFDEPRLRARPFLVKETAFLSRAHILSSEGQSSMKRPGTSAGRGFREHLWMKKALGQRTASWRRWRLTLV